MILLDQRVPDNGLRVELGGEPAPWDEQLRRSWNTTLTGGLVVGEIESSRRAYDEHSDAVFAATNERLVNPYYRAKYRPRALYPPHLRAHGPQEGIEDVFSAYQREADELAAKHPDHAEVIRRRPSGGAIARRAEEEQASSWARRDSGATAWAAWAAWMAGSFGAALAKDPTTWMGLAAGPFANVPRGAFAIAQQGIKTAIINAGMETAVQPVIQDWRRRAGLEYGVSDAALQVAMAGALGFGLDVGIRVPYRGGQRLAGRVPVLDRSGGVQTYTPRGQPPDPEKYGPTVPVLDAQGRVSAYRPGYPGGARTPEEALDIAAREAPPDSLLGRAVRGDPEAVVELAGVSGAIDDDAVRGAIQALRDYQLFGRPPDVADGEHALRMAEAIHRSIDPEAPPPGTAMRQALAFDDEDQIVAAWNRLRAAKDNIDEELEKTRRSLADLGIALDQSEAQVRALGRRALNQAALDRLQSAARDRGDDALRGGLAGPALREAFAIPERPDAGARPTLGGRPLEYGELDLDALPFDQGSLTRNDGGHGVAVAFQGRDGQYTIQRLGSARREVTTSEKPKAYIFREAEGFSIQDARVFAAVQNLKEMSGSAADMATLLRARPDLATRDLPLSDYKFKQAEFLRRLSDDAWERVAKGEVPEHYAAVVGDLVADETRHVEMLDAIKELMSREDRLRTSEDQVRLHLGQLLAKPMSAEAHQARLGVGATEGVRDLAVARTQVLDTALRLWDKDKRLFKLLDKEAAKITAVGNVLARDANEARAVMAQLIANVIRTLANVEGPVNDFLQTAAQAVNTGVPVRAASHAFNHRIADIWEAKGVDGLVPPRKPTPEIATKGMDDPFGKEAAQQIQDLELKAQARTDKGKMFAAPDDPEYWIGRYGGGAGKQKPKGKAGAKAETRPAVDSRRFETPGYIGHTVEGPKTAAGERTRQFWIHPEGTRIDLSAASDKAVTGLMKKFPTYHARAVLVEREPGRWELIDIRVRQNLRQMGVGTRLLDAMENQLGARLEAPGRLTPELFELWSKRDPEGLRWHSQVEGAHYSPRQLIELKRHASELGRNAKTPAEKERLAAFELKVTDAIARLPAEALPPVSGGRGFAAREGGGFTPSELRKLLDDEAEQTVGQWIGAKEWDARPADQRGSEHNQSYYRTVIRNLNESGLWQLRSADEVAQVLAQRRRDGLTVQPTRGEEIEGELTPPLLRGDQRRAVFAAHEDDMHRHVHKEGMLGLNFEVPADAVAAVQRALLPYRDIVADVLPNYEIAVVERIEPRHGGRNPPVRAHIRTVDGRAFWIEGNLGDFLGRGAQHSSVGTFAFPEVGFPPDKGLILIYRFGGSLRGESVPLGSQSRPVPVGLAARDNAAVGKGPYQGGDNTAVRQLPDDVAVGKLSDDAAVGELLDHAPDRDFWGHFERTVRGEFWHEVVHALFLDGVIDRRIWNRLVAHAERLQIMDITNAEFRRLTEVPAAKPTNRSLRELYREDLEAEIALRDIPDKETVIKAIIGEEGVAHMLQLVHHGALPEAAILPIRAELEAVFRGRSDSFLEMLLQSANENRARHRGQLMFAARQQGGSFTTARGSTYEITPDGTTIRTKAARSDPGHEGDFGLKPQSERTYYVTPADGQRLGAPPGTSWRIVDHGDDTVSLATRNPDGRWGVAPTQRNIPVSTTPEVGKQPVELWGKETIHGRDAYRKVHLGNDITEMRPFAQPLDPERGFARPRPGRFHDISDGNYTLTDRGAAAMAEIRQVIDTEAERILPDFIRTRVVDRIVFRGQEMDAVNDPYELMVSIALNGALRRRTGALGLIRHEAAEILERLGFLEKRETAVIYAEAERQGLREKYNIDGRYLPLYQEFFPDDPAGLEARLRSETIWHMFEEYERGTRFGPLIDAIIEPIVRFFERLRNYLAGRGFDSASDVFDRILSGEVARRDADIAVWIKAIRENAQRTGLEQARAQIIEAHSGPGFAARDGEEIGRQVEIESRNFTREIKNFEKSLWEAGRTAEQVAAAINEKYRGAFDPVTPAQMARAHADPAGGHVWWHIQDIPEGLESHFTLDYDPDRLRETSLEPENIAAPTEIDARPAAPQTLTPMPAQAPRPRPAPLSPELRAEIVALYDGGRGLNTGQISTQLSQRTGSYVGTTSVANVLEDVGVFTKGFGGGSRNVLPPNAVERLLDPAFGTKPLKEQAAALKRELKGVEDPVTFLSKLRYKLRQEGRDVPEVAMGPPITVYRPEIEARLLDPEFAALSLAQQKAGLKDEFDLDVTVKALAQKRADLRAAGHEVPGARGISLDDFQWTDEAIAKLTSPELAGLSAAEKARILDPDGGLTAAAIRQRLFRIRRDEGAEAAPSQRRPWPEDAKAWLASEEASAMPQGKAAQAIKERFGFDVTAQQVNNQRFQMRRRAAALEAQNDGARTADLANMTGVCKP